MENGKEADTSEMSVGWEMNDRVESMENKYLKQTLIAPSMSDGLGFLSHQSTFALFMDMAMEHAMKLGIGLD